MTPQISRQFYLISLNPKNGFYFNVGNFFSMGLLGSVLLDLYATGKITLQNKRVVIVNPERTGNPMFDRPLDLVSRKGSITIVNLLTRMSMGMKSNLYKKELLAYLRNEGELIAVQKKFLGIRYFRYFPVRQDNRMALIRRIRYILLRNEKPEPTELLILSLIHVTRQFRPLSDLREERKIMRNKLKLLLKNGNSYSADFETINELSLGIRRAIMSANARNSAVY